MKTITVPADRARLDEVNAFLREELDKCGCPMKARMQIELAVEELFVNIASYSGSERAEIAIETEDRPRSVTIRFSDWGAPFDPLARPDADISLSAEDRQIGGLGILLVKKNMDAVSYNYQDGKNVLTIQKLLPAGDCP